MGATPAMPRLLHFDLLPQTRLGRCSMGLLVTAGGFFLATTLLANVGGLGGSGWLAFTIVPWAIFTLASIVTAAIAIIRDRERGGLVFIPLLLALALAWFIIGEFVGPSH